MRGKERAVELGWGCGSGDEIEHLFDSRLDCRVKLAT
jgi:hypothetical protein